MGDMSSEEICSPRIMVHTCKLSYSVFKASLSKSLCYYIKKMVESLVKKDSVCLEDVGPH